MVGPRVGLGDGVAMSEGVASTVAGDVGVVVGVPVVVPAQAMRNRRNKLRPAQMAL